VALNFGQGLFKEGEYSSIGVPLSTQDVNTAFSQEATGAANFGTVPTGKVWYVMMLSVTYTGTAYLKLLKADAATGIMMISCVANSTATTPYGVIYKYTAGQVVYFEHTANSSVSCTYIEV